MSGLRASSHKACALREWPNRSQAQGSVYRPRDRELGMMWVSSLPLLGSPDFSLSTHLFGVVSWQALSPTFEPLICLLGPIKVVPHCPTWSSGTQPIMATAPRIGLELLIPAVALRPLPGNVGIGGGTFSRAANSLLSWGCNLWTLTLEEVPSHPTCNWECKQPVRGKGRWRTPRREEPRGRTWPLAAAVASPCP